MECNDYWLPTVSGWFGNKRGKNMSDWNIKRKKKKVEKQHCQLEIHCNHMTCHM